MTLRGQASLGLLLKITFYQNKLSPTLVCRIVNTIVYAILRAGLPFERWVKNGFSKKKSLIPEIEPHQIDISPSLYHW